MTTFLKTTQIAIDGARTLPRRYLRRPEIFAEETERIFHRRWLCVGREDRIAQPGDYFVQQVGNGEHHRAARQGGRLRAYYNVCRHRGTRLCEEHTGRFSETIQCPYHAWTYALDGRLIGAPSTTELEGFDKADYPLHPVAVAELGRVPLHQPGRRSRAVRPGLRAADRPVRPLQPAESPVPGPSSTT